MIETIKRLISRDYKTRVRKFELPMSSIKALRKLSPKSHDLLIDIIEQVGAGLEVDNLIVTGNHEDFGFKHKHAFYRSRSELVKAGFIVHDRQDHYVNPVMIGYNTRRQLDCFYRLFKIKTETPVNMGQFDR
jgi:hypothetical protein